MGQFYCEMRKSGENFRLVIEEAVLSGAPKGELTPHQMLESDRSLAKLRRKCRLSICGRAVAGLNSHFAEIKRMFREPPERPRPEVCCPPGEKGPGEP